MTTPLRVLIADDTPDVRELLHMALELQRGLEVVGEAADGVEAVAAAEQLTPDALLLDLAMPRMDGLQAIPEVRRVSPHTKIIVLSGFEASVTANEALSRGAHAYVPKGTAMPAIAAKIREVCGAQAPAEPVSEAASQRAPAEPRGASPTIPTIVHELRNQAIVVEGFSKALLSAWGDLDDAARRDYFERVARNAAQMRALVDVLGDVNRIDANALDLACRPVSLAGLVRETADDMVASSARDITLVTTDDPRVRADPIRLRQVLTNLLSNAAKFTPDGSPITVTVRARDGYGEVEVADCGPGIPLHRRHELFAPFARLGATAPGTGLGLYISRGIMQAHRGTLALADSDEGARFVVRLPLLPAPHR